MKARKSKKNRKKDKLKKWNKWSIKRPQRLLVTISTCTLSWTKLASTKKKEKKLFTRLSNQINKLLFISKDTKVVLASAIRLLVRIRDQLCFARTKEGVSVVITISVWQNRWIKIILHIWENWEEMLQGRFISFLIREFSLITNLIDLNSESVWALSNMKVISWEWRVLENWKQSCQRSIALRTLICSNSQKSKILMILLDPTSIDWEISLPDGIKG